MLTLYRRDPVSARIVAVAIGTCLVVGTVDLVVRLVRRSTLPGVGSMLVGALLVLFSLFGLVLGLLGIGSVGVLVAASAWPLRPTGGVGAGEAPGVPAAWYADPGGSGGLRHWDGATWGSPVEPAGRPPVGDGPTDRGWSAPPRD